MQKEETDSRRLTKEFAAYWLELLVDTGLVAAHKLALFTRTATSCRSFRHDPRPIDAS